MTRPFLHLFFELSPFPPSLSALLSGFATIGFDGRLWLTELGEEYLRGLEVRQLVGEAV